MRLETELGGNNMAGHSKMAEYICPNDGTKFFLKGGGEGATTGKVVARIAVGSHS